MTRLLRLVCCWLILGSILLPAVPGHCNAREDSARKSLMDSLHKQAKFLLETSIIGYTQIRHTPSGALFYITDLTGNSYFLFPSSAISSKLQKMLLESYKEGKFIKLNGLMVTWDDHPQPGKKAKESGFFVDSATTYAWADPIYAQMRTEIEQEKREQQKKKLQAKKKAEQRKNDPAHIRELNEKAAKLKKQREQGKAPQGAPPRPPKQ